MIAKLLISSNLNTRIGEIEMVLGEINIKNPHPDLLYFVDEEKLGIEAAKRIREHFSLKPYQAKGRVVALESSQNLTLDAQNSLLKTIEELPEQALMLLGVDSELSILPTVVSRCQLHFLSERTKSVLPGGFTEDIKGLLQENIEQRFEYIEKLEEKKEFLEALIVFFRNKLQEDQVDIKFVKKLMEAEKWQKANVNLRAILEYLMLEMPRN